MNYRLAAPFLTLALLAGCTAPPVPPATADPRPTPAVVSANEPTPTEPTPTEPKPSANAKRPVVQVAILLDTSGSMDGLIDQAKAQLWKIVNEFGAASQNGARPRLELALYEYGKATVPAQAGFVKQIVPFTDDLDKLSEELFKLQTNGGSEYCGWAVRSALRDLAWSKDPKTLKVIFIAGNEEFTQGPVAYQKVFEEARQRGILVNTIYCGDKTAGVNDGWQGGAVAGQGRYLVIDHNQAVAYVEAPQDKELARLSEEMNKSYVAYGSGGSVALGRQTKVEAYSRNMAPAVAAERAKVKAGSAYSNAQWDLVDATVQNQVDLATLKDEELPVDMRGLTVEKKQAYVQAKQAERKQVQAQIQKLSAERDQFLARNAAKDEGTLQSAVIQAVREQAATKGYEFKK